MPFWWKRRRKPWYGYRFKYKRRRYNRKRWRRPRYRRKHRYATRRRRRRRRRYKVRRKKPTIPIRQWQPDSINKCKIKGYEVLIVGGEGRQMYCYTNQRDKTVRPRTPSGGGFCYQLYSLKYLYTEHLCSQNIWTASNIYKDLVRYLYVDFYFFRHDFIDFIINYDIQPPFTLQKYTYSSIHPLQMLLAKNKIILLSKASNPKGKIYKRKRIRPPKQMISKWFFSDAFVKHTLCTIRAAATDMRFSYQGCCNENQQLGIYYLNQLFYQKANWGVASSPYIPSNAYGTTTNFTVDTPTQKQISVTVKTDSYNNSVSYADGWFQKNLLLATSIKVNQQLQAALPVQQCLYNPNLDSGQGNAVWLSSIHNTTYDQPTKDPSILITNLPLWLAIYGLLDYIEELKATKDFLKTHIVIISSISLLPYPQPGWQKGVIPLDKSFLEGKAFFDQPPTSTDKVMWYPTVEHQVGILNEIVKCGPYIPKLNNQKYSTWELKCKYVFHFKFGGPQVSEKEVADPSKQDHYDVPDTVQGNVQIEDPTKQIPESFIQPWDYRRGFLKESALKRIRENIPLDSSFQTDQEEGPPCKKRYFPKLQAPQQKNKEILQCLHSLCEDNTCQDSEEKSLKQLILHQQQQQLQIKLNLLQLLAELKSQQRMLQLQTGLLE
nr:MAG: ORF1 [Torque teno midi virus]